MRRTRRRYLLVKYDGLSYSSDRIRELMSQVAENLTCEDSHFKRTFFLLKPGLAILSVPHRQVSKAKERISSLGLGLEVVLTSGTLEGIRRKTAPGSSQKGLSQPHQS